MTRFSIVIGLLLGAFSLSAQVNLQTPVRDAVRADRMLSSGLDRTYDLSAKPSSPAPRGYEPVYISHYGRHGSRYAYTSKAYTVPLEALRGAAAAGNLTPRGRKLLSDLERFWEKGRYKVGDLAPLGWKQHEGIARTMVKSFPRAFGKGSRVDACSSPSVRSIMSMASCCAAISRVAPKSDVYAHQGILDIQATRPNRNDNPFRYTGPESVFPYSESPKDFFLRKFPGYTDVLGRLFKDPAAALGDGDPHRFCFFYYMFVAGMNSLPEEEKIDVSGLITDEEFAILWETDSYERLREYLPYRTPCSSIVDDIVAKADERLTEGSRGADLRFGHDHVVMSLMMIMDIAGTGVLPPSSDDLVNHFRTFLSPMAANIQFVFYVPRRQKEGDVLMKVLLNGEETTLGSLEPAEGPYYRWNSVKEYLQGRTKLFVNR